MLHSVTQATGYDVARMCRQLRGEIAQLAASAAEVSLRDAQANRRAWAVRGDVCEFDRMALRLSEPALRYLAVLETVLAVPSEQNDAGECQKATGGDT